MKMLRQFRALIIGAPGSGKGTISSRIVRKFDMKYIASGDILRQNILQNTPVGNEAKSYMDKGQLVPDETMISLVMAEVNRYADHNLLIDGFPRTVKQANILSSYVSIDVALNLEVPSEVIIDRIKGRWIHPASGRVYNVGFNPPKTEGKDDATGDPLVQRNDDKPEAVKKRLEIYFDTIGPLLELYREKGILEEFSGRTSDEIWPMVYKYLTQHFPLLQGERKL